jgi:hypothetical protein
LTTEERVQAVADYGFTDRQARFLVLVMRHSGLCIKRQYGTFAGIKPGGEKCNAFFEKLVRRGFAVTSACIHNRARLYHVHHKPLYHAIGEPESRYRRAVPARQAVNRLMRLDAALIGPDLDWLTTRAEKLELLAARRAADSVEPAATATVDDAELLPGTFPIGIDAHGRLVVLFVVTVPWTEDFRLFLFGHAPLLVVSPLWTVRLVFPQALQRVVTDYETAVREELASPLGDMANEVNWYFFHRRRATDWSEYTGSGGELIKAKFARYTKDFAGPRFALLYRRWLTQHQAALAPTSPLITDALASGRGSIESTVLPHAYELFSPLVSPRRAPRRRIMADAARGEVTSRAQNPALN